MMKALILLFLIFLSFGVKAQITLSGVVLDSMDKVIPYANVYHPPSMQGTVTNDSGVYSLRLNDLEKSDSILFSFVGYDDVYVLIHQLLKNDTLVLYSATKVLKTAFILEDGVNAYSIVLDAFDKIPENFSQEERTVYAYYRENLFQSKQFVGDEKNKVVHGGRSVEAAIKITEGSYKHSIKLVEEKNCVLSIRKPKDTIFHSKLPIKFITNRLSLLQWCNIAKYNDGEAFNKEKKLKKRYNLVIEQVIQKGSTEHIYKISFVYKDSTNNHYKGCFWISSDNYKLYRYELHNEKGVYGDKNTMYYNNVPHHRIVSYVPSPDGLVLSYLKDYYIYEVRNKDRELIIYDVYDTELIYVSPDKFKNLTNDCHPIDKKNDLSEQVENSNPEFWREFNVE